MMNEHLLISICMYSIINHSQSIQHDELQRKTSCSHHRDSVGTFALGIPKGNLFLGEFPWSFGLASSKSPQLTNVPMQ